MGNLFNMASTVEDIFSLLQEPYALPAVYSIAALSILYLLYLWVLPKPIPGIPYDESARRNLLGNLPEIREYVRKTGRLRPWITSHPARLNSALTQVWLGPFQKPALILADFQETQDMLLRRGKEFDRSKRSYDIFRGIIEYHHISMSSTDPRFKGNKELVRDLMTPGFLNEVSAPQIYAKTMTLIELWALKFRLAGGHPFEAKEDLSDAAIDMINAAAFGLDESMSTVKSQLDALTALSGQKFSASADGSVEFPRVPQKPEITAIRALGTHLGEQSHSTNPKFKHYYKLLFHPTFTNDIALKDKLIHDEIEKALVRLQGEEGETRSAMDHIIQREINSAAKGGRTPSFHSRRVYDELFGYFLGGHETSSTALYWIVKNLADYPETQEKLRSALRSAYAVAYKEGRQPSVTEITKNAVPYLDAVIEESLRINSPFPLTTRQAKVDTILLGRKIPKDTMVFLTWDGPDFKSPGIPVEEDMRSERSRQKYLIGHWDPTDVHLFKPERWLKVDEDGKEVYDSQSGPILAFGLGPRGCFGKRLAYLELRTVLALLVWNFQFNVPPGELGSRSVYDSFTTAPLNCYVALSKADKRL
ncbi:cytochrome P450 [Hypoxylon trugodes]|uniref:cytochrome P450 n=1 Tax=Hypoxylon trugodes TaxID=326681 RepID=UPI00219F01B5|nr:cytochrome P450 [Hypoxylon trugodes]KAI1385993.1 cytochrome P450 [Hypoxylon trugodes]